MIRAIQKQLDRLESNGLPFRYELTLWNEDDDDQDASVSTLPAANKGIKRKWCPSDIMYVKLWISKENCPALEYDYVDELYFDFHRTIPLNRQRLVYWTQN